MVMDMSEVMAKQEIALREAVKKYKNVKTRIIAITSGKGGVGKTSLSVNLAIMFARMGENVLLMDADLGLANVNVLLGMAPEYTLYDVVKGNKTLSNIVMDIFGIKIIPGASGFSILANLPEDIRKKLIEEFKTLEEYSIIILDTSAGLSYNVISFLLSADDVLVLTTPEPPAITDAYGIIKVISTRGIENIKLIANRVKSLQEANRVLNKLHTVARKFLEIDIDELGFIFEDEIVRKSIYKQIPFVEGYPKSKASICVEIIASKLLNKEPPNIKERGIGRFLSKFFQ